MNAILNYLFSSSSAVAPDPPPRPSDVVVVSTNGNTMMVYKLSKIKDLGRDELLAWRRELVLHAAQSFDVKDVDNTNTLLDAIEKRLTT